MSTTTFHLSNGPVEIPLGSTRITRQALPVECVGAEWNGTPIWVALADGPRTSAGDPIVEAGDWMRLDEADMVPLVSVNWERVG